MSWSVSASGSPEVALAEARRQFAGTCANGLPTGEAARGEKVMAAVEAAVLVVEAGKSVTIQAWGSESYNWADGQPGALLQAQASYTVTVQS